MTVSVEDEASPTDAEEQHGQPDTTDMLEPHADAPPEPPAESADVNEARIRASFFEALNGRSRELSESGKTDLAEELAGVGNFLRNGLPRQPGSESVEHLLDNIQKSQSLTRGVQDSFELIDFELLGHLRLLVESYKVQKRDREWGTFTAIMTIVEQEMRRNARIKDSHEVAKLVCSLLVSTQLTVLLQNAPEEHKPGAKELLRYLVDAAEKAGAEGLIPAFNSLLEGLTTNE